METIICKNAKLLPMEVDLNRRDLNEKI